MSGGNETAIDFEAVVASEEGDVGFVVANFYGDEGAVGIGNVRRVGDDDFEVLAGHGREEIAVQEADLLGQVVAGRISARDCECGLRDIDGGESSRWEVGARGQWR